MLHKWQHHESCTRGCRYRVPHPPAKETGFDEEGALVLQRHPGNEYLTPFILLLPEKEEK